MGSNEVEKKKYVFTWRVKNFSMCSENTGESFSSPVFNAKNLDETAWFIELFPRGKVDSRYITCLLHREQDPGPTAIEYECLFEMIYENGTTLGSENNKHVIQKSSKIRQFKMCSMLRDKLKNAILHEDTLTIRCQLSVPGKSLCCQNFCSTIIKTKNYSLQWNVENLNSFPSKQVAKFSFSEYSQIEIDMEIPEDDIEIFIKLKTKLSSNFVVCNCVLLDTEGKQRDSKRTTYLFQPGKTWQFPTFIKKSKLNAESDIYLKDDCFSLKCDFTISDGTTSQLVEEMEGCPPLTNKFTISDVDTIAILNEDIRRLHADKIFTDVKLKVDEQIFSAHKCILSARSPVLFTMFNQDMIESRTGEVVIPDLDAKTVDLFLEYIYTGTVNGLDYENVMKLIVAADKYQVLALKNKCAELLKSVLSDANVCEILVTADLIQHDILKAAVFDYIKKHPKKIFNSEEWKQCVKNNLLLATETSSAVAILLADLATEQSGK